MLQSFLEFTIFYKTYMIIKKIFIQTVCYINYFTYINNLMDNLLYYIENKFISVYNNRLKNIGEIIWKI